MDQELTGLDWSLTSASQGNRGQGQDEVCLDVDLSVAQDSQADCY